MADVLGSAREDGIKESIDSAARHASLVAASDRRRIGASRRRRSSGRSGVDVLGRLIIPVVEAIHVLSDDTGSASIDAQAVRVVARSLKLASRHFAAAVEFQTSFNAQLTENKYDIELVDAT